VIAVASVAVWLAESATWNVRLVTAVVVGVPVMAPVEAFKDNPPGNEPELTVHVYGVVPPVATKVAA
jgi:hypothetical protein